MSELGDIVVDWDAIPKTGGSLPAGDYLLNCREVSDEIWESNGKRCLIAKFDVVEPASAAGLYFTDFCFVGTDTDPKAEDPATWASPKNRSAQRVRDFFNFAKVGRGKMAYMCAEAVGHQVEARVTETTNKQTEKTYTNAKYFERGTLAFGTAAEKAAGGIVSQVPRPNGAAGAPVVVGTPKVVKVGTPASETVVAASPRTVKPQTVKCPECDVVVPKSEFLAHSAGHDED